MSLRKGLARAGRTLDSPRKSLGGGAVRSLSLSSPAGWLTGGEDISMSRDKAMKGCTAAVRSGANYAFGNKAAVNGFAFNFRVTAERGPSGQGGYITSIQGGFQ